MLALSTTRSHTIMIMLAGLLALPASVPAAETAPLAPTVDAVATLTRQIDTVSLRISIFPGVETFGLREVLLHQDNLLIEPPARWPDGEPAGGAARVSAEDMLEIVTSFADAELFALARKSYSARAGSPPDGTEPPPNALQYQGDPVPPSPPALAFQFVAHDDTWSFIYDITLPWEDAAHRMLRSMNLLVGAEAGALLDALEMQLDMKPLEIVSE